MQPEFGRAEMHEAAVAQHAMGRQVHHQAAIGQYVTRGRRLGPPQHRPHPRHQLAGAERLGDVVVGADLQSAHAVRLLAARRQHDDRLAARGGLAPDLPAHFEPGDERQHPVEDDQVRLAFLDRRQPFLAVDGDRHAVALFFEVVAQQLDQCRLVFDNQNMRTHSFTS